METKDLFYLGLFALMLYLLYESNKRLAAINTNLTAIDPGNQVQQASQQLIF